MTEIVLHPQANLDTSSSPNPLPQLLQTPSGLAILELQGTINLPDHQEGTVAGSIADEIYIGRLVFPFYDAKEPGGGDGWMKKVWLYVGKHQRLTGEVKKLPKALAIIQKRKVDESAIDLGSDDTSAKSQDLEVVEIVKYKILFSLRPEPVGTLET